MTESKSAWRSALLAAYLRWKYRQRFYSVRVGGFAGWQDWLASEAPYPLVFFGNHQSWWDGLLDFSLTRHFGMDNRLMMEAKNLAQFSFFQKCGVFGVDLDSARGRGAGLLHAVRLLQEPSTRRCLILYPQGRLVPDWEDVPLQEGLEIILRKAPGVTALPVWRRLHLGKHELPEAEIEIGEPLSPGGGRTTAQLANALNATKMALETRLSVKNDKQIIYISKGINTLRGGA
ncbi:1-acyl-sn-glycerol-3-phosphate acyltransferase [Cerasicoccus arenae]|nr:1-acyl-sn-glycerol-3-phosphate acyltransferase [Cerasicoccus arenae]MBK1859551.1 1-acyl-sn-glycerol-3-phosphate acyltransferase [Cerasicoccus arenae]